ncbi:MAG: Ni/Fe hydrogenase subunit alpha [Planctomycetes bacterium]|nr:Ni/Fe hydrogenase subunit alpha [Planctomycetota bacterium]
MSRTVEFDVHHVTRVEGHGNIKVRVKNGTVDEVRWLVPEAPRFFEAMVRGRSWEDIQTVVSRICGICSVTHSLASIKAVEAALGVEISRQTDRLRILAHYGEQVESHVLHVGYLVAPDLLGQKSVVPLVTSHPEVVQTVIALHKLGNHMMEVLAGRKTHPIRLKPGGFAKLPTEAELRDLKARLQAAVPQLEALAEVILSLAGELPDFRRETEYIALVNPPHYPFYHGQIGSTDTDERVPVAEFERVVNEYVSPQSTAKWTRWHRDAYGVGALARFNLNAEHLAPLATKVAASFGLEKGCTNPYLNNVAQLVEVVHVVERSMGIVDELLEAGIRPEKPHVEPRAGVGVGCVEAPRGILFHKYEFDERGRCLAANICIPTNQNHANIQKDFEALLPEILDEEEDAIRLKMEMLVRAYDPCISCSTHYLDVEFV